MMSSKSSSTAGQPQATEVRKGPWSMEEDLTLTNYISVHGEGVWNTVARSAGLNRTGKSCRLRWLNYLKPEVKRGNITSDEERLIIELHTRWGNRWSKIAKQLPGRTDNEIKNFWRTKIQKKSRTSMIQDDDTHYKFSSLDFSSDCSNPYDMSSLMATTSQSIDSAPSLSAYSNTDDMGHTQDDLWAATNTSLSAMPDPIAGEYDLCCDHDLWSMQFFNGDLI